MVRFWWRWRCCVCVVNDGEENGDKNRANSFSGNDERSGKQKRKLKEGNESWRNILFCLFYFAVFCTTCFCWNFFFFSHCCLSLFLQLYPFFIFFIFFVWLIGQLRAAILQRKDFFKFSAVKSAQNNQKIIAVHTNKGEIKQTSKLVVEVVVQVVVQTLFFFFSVVSTTNYYY